MADELKALGNKAIAEKDFDQAVYVYSFLSRGFRERERKFPKALVKGLENSRDCFCYGFLSSIKAS